MNTPLLTNLNPAPSPSQERIITGANVAEWLAQLEVPHPEAKGVAGNIVPFPKTVQPAVGVFCDSRIYAMFISNELTKSGHNVHCLLHPGAFTAARFPHLDKAAGWILCLTGPEITYEPFLEAFLERYGDRNGLYMFERSKREKMSGKIQGFIQELFR